MNKTLGDYWVVVTSNNLGAVSADVELFETRHAAELVADDNNKNNANGRHDWQAERLTDAINHTIDEACANAKNED